MLRNAAFLALICLIFFGHHLWCPFPHHQDIHDEIIHQKVLKICPTQELIDFARTHDPALIKSNDELVRMLAEAGLSNGWMVVVTRSLMGQAGILDGQVIIHLGQHTYQFELTRNYLLTLAGKPPSEYFAGARIVVVPARLMAKDPRIVLPEILAL